MGSDPPAPAVGAPAPPALGAPASPSLGSAAPSLGSAAPLTASAAVLGPVGGPGRLVVLLRRPRRATPSAHAAAALRSAVEGTVARAGGRLAGREVAPIGLLTVTPGPHGAAGLTRALQANHAVVSVTPERRFSPRSVPDDPALTLPDPVAPSVVPAEWWAARENLPAAWAITLGDGALVAVIDTGVDASHPEFAGKVVADLEHDSTPGDGPAGTDPVGHGTHVASLACAATGNGQGIAGAGADCGLLVEKSDLTDDSVAASLVEATDRGAQAVVMSFGGEGQTAASPAVARALAYAAAHQVVLVAAADDRPVSEQGPPADALQPTGTGPTLGSGIGLSVTAADAADARAPFAGFGTQISMAAYGAYLPGMANEPLGLLGAFPSAPTSLEQPTINPLAPGCGCRVTFTGDSRYAELQGTSMAAPQVGAVAALMRRLNPDLGASDVIRVLEATARRSAGAGWTSDLGWGILDAGAALDAARRIDRRAPISRPYARARTRARSVLLQVVASDPAPAGLIASGVASVELFGAPAGRPVRRLARLAPGARFRLRGRAGQLWRLRTVAVDRAGNREHPPSAVEARVRFLGQRRGRR